MAGAVKPLPLGAAALVAALLLAGCSASGAPAARFVPTDAQSSLGAAKAWQPALLVGLGDPGSSGLDAWPGQFDAAPTAYDLDGDGVDEVIAQAADTKVYVFRAATGHVLAVLPTTIPPAWHIEKVLNTVEVAVLRPGEAPSLVVTDHAAYVAVWRFNAAASTADHFSFDRQFDLRMDECRPSPGMDAKAAVGDLDGDGELEIVVQTEERGFFALRADGSTLWSKCWGGGNSAPVIADLDGNGRPEVILGSDAGLLSVLDGATGAPRWTYDARQAGIDPASISVSPTVAELDGVAPLEILFTARHAPRGGPETYAQDHLAIFAVHQNPASYQAELLWMRQPEWGNPLSNTQLVAHDIDGDGAMDILGMDWNTIGHYPGDWERLGPAHVFRLDAQGNDVWVREMETWWSNQDIAVADLDGAGQLSVLVNGPAGPYDGLWRLSADTGMAEGFLPLAGWKVARGPQLADLHHDGSMQLLFPVKPIDDEARGAIVVFDLGVPYDAPWRGVS
ncbi:MAG: FG-GAP repeat domain-containing protein [Thermoplasmatota archaeon]